MPTSGETKCGFGTTGALQYAESTQRRLRYMAGSKKDVDFSQMMRHTVATKLLLPRMGVGNSRGSGVLICAS